MTIRRFLAAIAALVLGTALTCVGIAAPTNAKAATGEGLHCTTFDQNPGILLCSVITYKLVGTKHWKVTGVQSSIYTGRMTAKGPDLYAIYDGCASGWSSVATPSGEPGDTISRRIPKHGSFHTGTNRGDVQPRSHALAAGTAVVCNQRTVGAAQLSLLLSAV